MKKLFLILAFLLIPVIPANADVMPCYVNNISPESIGVYQASNNIKIYEEPNENSPLMVSLTWNAKTFNSADVSASNLFIVFIPKKELAFLTVIDENENEDWMEVSFNQNGNKTGWIKKEDEYRFMSWRTFFNLYGRKYGLYYMKDAPSESKLVYGATSEEAKSIAQITYPQNLKLTGVSGNWFLVIAFDVDRTQKIGWIKWRNISGQIYLFPDIK